MAGEGLDTGYGRFAGVAERLAGHHFSPVGAGELARELGMTRQQAHAALRSLENVGWAEQVSDGWRLTPRLTLIAARLADAFSAERSRYLDGASSADTSVE